MLLLLLLLLSCCSPRLRACLTSTPGAHMILMLPLPWQLLPALPKCRVGDLVFGQAEGCLATHVLADERRGAPLGDSGA